MKIFLAKYEPNRIGGGWTFQRHFAKGMEDLVTYDYDEADIYFVSSPSMVMTDDVEKAKQDGKKTVIRLDNATRNSRNKRNGMDRMKTKVDLADMVIYQSEWAKNYLGAFLKRDGEVILNGVDTEVFLPGIDNRDPHTILYSRFNRDETKNWEAARYWYSQYQLIYPDAKLIITGQFADELKNNNFDFYNGERFEFAGLLEERNMAKIYRLCSGFLYTYFNDACSNSIIEALVSGCNIVGDDYYLKTGGTPEIIEKFKSQGAKYFTLQRMCTEYRGVLNDL